MNIKTVWKSVSIACVCLGLVGCTPGVQSQTQTNVSSTKSLQQKSDWSGLEQAIQSTALATMYKIKSNVSLKNGSMHTNYSVYGTVNMPGKMSIAVHENNFNISFYQQGKVAYADEQGNWTQTTPIEHFNAFTGYENLVQQAQSKHIVLTQLPKKFIVNEYCDVYQFTLPSAQVKLPSFLSAVTGGTGTVKVSNQAGESVQYTMYVGQKSKRLRQVETQSVNSVNELGPVATNTTATFFDIDKPKIAVVTIPKTLVKQLEGSVK